MVTLAFGDLRIFLIIFNYFSFFADWWFFGFGDLTMFGDLRCTVGDLRCTVGDRRRPSEVFNVKRVALPMHKNIYI